VVDGVVEDVVERVVVLLLGFDHPRPEPFPEDVVDAAMALVEGARVLAVQVTHPVGEIRERRLDHEVVVVSEQAARVKPPAVALSHALQDLDEDGAVPVVEEDRRVVVSLGAEVVVRAGGEVAVRASHRGDRTAGASPEEGGVSVPLQRRHRLVTCQARDAGSGDPSPAAGVAYAATLERSRCWCDGQ
jgi:hypothetical protein